MSRPAPARPAGVFDVLDATRAAHPGSPAVVTRQGVFTYAELDESADRAAGALYDLGLRPGDRVAAAWPNDLDIILAFHGAMRLGAIWVGVSRALAPPEKAYLVSDSGARLVLADDAIATVSPAAWQDALAASRGRPPVPAPDPEAPAAIAYTSGTTGFPKGAVHCQAGLIMPGAATVARRGWGSELRKGDSLPLTILNLMVLTTLLTAQAGGTAVIIDRTDVASIAAWIRREQVTIWNGPPAQLHSMVGDASITRADLASLHEVWVGGGDCSDELRRSFQDRFGVRVSRTYGLTEAPALVSLDDLDDLDDLDREAPAGTSGRPLDHIDVQSIDGELVLSPTATGPWAGCYRPSLGYWKQEPAPGRALSTGDLGAVEPNGHLKVLGRKSQLIIRGGANIYPAEVERVLALAPGVAGCAVVGVPDERLGERVGAVVESRPGEPPDEAAILAHCRHWLAAYKVPERLVVVARLPRNQMGKVPRAQLLELLAGAPRIPPEWTRSPDGPSRP